MLWSVSFCSFLPIYFTLWFYACSLFSDPFSLNSEEFSHNRSARRVARLGTPDACCSFLMFSCIHFCLYIPVFLIDGANSMQIICSIFKFLCFFQQCFVLCLCGDSSSPFPKKLYLCFRVLDKVEDESETVFRISEELPTGLFKVYRLVVQTRSQTLAIKCTVLLCRLVAKHWPTNSMEDSPSRKAVSSWVGE